MIAYEVRRVHSCEFCGTDDQGLGTDGSLDRAKSIAECDAGLALEWAWFTADGEWPLCADPGDGVYRYYIYAREPAS
ncbi:hypothetical protein AB0L63_05000 [Nocardia sp. NPDC051990]|uniref:hypothetical protein n=1 Tax=Nocardia sp. NPDC051990 TaxID=3155285 RepID=UPI0034159658